MIHQLTTPTALFAQIAKATTVFIAGVGPTATRYADIRIGLSGLVILHKTPQVATELDALTRANLVTFDEGRHEYILTDLGFAQVGRSRRDEEQAALQNFVRFEQIQQQNAASARHRKRQLSANQWTDPRPIEAILEYETQIEEMIQAVERLMIDLVLKIRWE
jgi:hypothetical protein